MSDDSLLLTVEDLAGLLKLSRATVYMLLSDGRLPLTVHKIGRATRFVRAEVESYVQAGMPPAAEWRRREGGRAGG